MCVVLARLMLQHRETRRASVDDTGWSRKRLGGVSAFRDFCFFNGIAVDIGFRERGSQLDRRHILSGVVRSGFLHCPRFGPDRTEPTGPGFGPM